MDAKEDYDPNEMKAILIRIPRYLLERIRHDAESRTQFVSAVIRDRLHRAYPVDPE